MQGQEHLLQRDLECVAPSPVQDDAQGAVKLLHDTEELRDRWDPADPRGRAWRQQHEHVGG
eukprot:2938591-Lingulodinium_polyedra.AAC.1